MGIEKMTIYFGPAPKPRRRLGDQCRDREGKTWEAVAKMTRDHRFGPCYLSDGRGGSVLEWLCEDGRKRDRKPRGAKNIKRRF